MTNYFQHMKTHLEILWQTRSRLCICNQLNESKTRNIKLEATADVPYIHYESNKKNCTTTVSTAKEINIFCI